MDFQLSEEHLLIQRTVREFAEKEIAPRAEEIDATDKFPTDLFKRMAELGILGIPFSETYGGAGGDYISLLLALEEIARVSGSMAIILDAHTSLCCEPINLFGTEAQKQKYLVPLDPRRKDRRLRLDRAECGLGCRFHPHAGRTGGERVGVER